MIFTLSPGRCGTKYLANILDTVPETAGKHEPEPAFVEMSVVAQRRPDVARKWLERVKLPAIELYERMGADVYVETSHMVMNGFVGPLLELADFDAIVLRRPKEEVALSYWRKGSIPGRTGNGSNCLLDPRSVEDWHLMSDYELCLWHVKETERRIEAYIPMVEKAGGTVVETALEEIATGDGMMRLCERLELPPPAIVKTAPCHRTPDELRSTFPEDFVRTGWLQ